MRRVPAALAFALLGAHFFRSGAFALLLACVGLMALAFLRRPWARRVATVALVLGSLEWLRTLLELAGERELAGEPIARLVAILGGVSLFTLLSGVVLATARDEGAGG